MAHQDGGLSNRHNSEIAMNVLPKTGKCVIRVLGDDSHTFVFCVCQKGSEWKNIMELWFRKPCDINIICAKLMHTYCLELLAMFVYAR